jgi:hypothetical protein
MKLKTHCGCGIAIDVQLRRRVNFAQIRRRGHRNFSLAAYQLNGIDTN